MTRHPPLTDLVRIVKKRVSDDQCVQIASSLTFTALLSIEELFPVRRRRPRRVSPRGW